MKILFTVEEYKQAKSKDLLRLECEHCHKPFKTWKNKIDRVGTNGISCRYCSKECKSGSQIKHWEVSCLQCGKQFFKYANQAKKAKNHFCSRSCSATYNNTHKRHGTRRSKLELWLEEQLNCMFPSITILYNQKCAINSELDIYIPNLHLAFELNGIFHYEPIYGEIKLANIQNNDERKFQACIEQKIELCILDVSSMKYFKPMNGKKYLDIIKNIIQTKINDE